LELEALLSFVKKYGLDNWQVKFLDPDLQIIRNKTARELSEKWEKVAPKMIPYLPSSCMLPGTGDRPTLPASQVKGFQSNPKTPAIQLQSVNFPVHRPSPRLGIPPFQAREGNQARDGNQALNWGRINPPSNGNFGPYFQGSSPGAFPPLHPLASVRPRALNPNLNTMNAQLFAQFNSGRPNPVAQNFRPMSVQRPQTAPLSFSEITLSAPANVGTEARPPMLFGAPLVPNKRNENGDRDPDNRK